MEEVDAELLITHVDARYVVWDKFLHIYKDRNTTKNCWQVCIELKSKKKMRLASLLGNTNMGNTLAHNNMFL